MRRAAGAIIVLLVLTLACAAAGEAAGSVSRETAAELMQNADGGELILPEDIVRIEEEAFAGISLKPVTLPAALTYIADNAFDPEVAFFVYKDSAAEEWAASHGRVYSVIGEEQEDLLEVLQFEPDPEDDRQRLVVTGYTGEAENLILPDEINGVVICRIGEEAFLNNETIRSIRLPGNLERIDSRAFMGSQIETVILPDSVSYLGGLAFAYCKALTKAVLPGNLESVSQEVFIGCTALKEVTMSVKFQSAGTGFRECENVETIHYLPGTEGIFNLQVGRNNSYLEYQSRRSLKLLDFREGITVIRDGALQNEFYDNENDCYAVERIQLPSTLKTIDDGAFSGLNCLTEVNLPEGLEILGNEAFSHCHSLVPPEIPSTVTVIGNDVFYDCWEPEPEEEP